MIYNMWMGFNNLDFVKGYIKHTTDYKDDLDLSINSPT